MLTNKNVTMRRNHCHKEKAPTKKKKIFQFILKGSSISYLFYLLSFNSNRIINGRVMLLNYLYFTKREPCFNLGFSYLQLFSCDSKNLIPIGTPCLRRYTDNQCKTKLKRMPYKLLPFLYKNWSTSFELNMDDIRTEVMLVFISVFLHISSICLPLKLDSPVT